jgi:23S rRNA A2030 N6-methylase RlmJ
VANKYFGNVGDVFKHLLLADILVCEQPREYWESHAGNALYDWVDSPARRHGINRFYRGVNPPSLDDAMTNSDYAVLLKTLNPSSLKIVPGSPLLAMRLLPQAQRFVFCDTDGDTLLEVKATAQKESLPDERFELLPDDGLSILHALAIQLSPHRARDVFAFLDPYDATAVTASAISPLALFGELAGRGIRTVLWYGYKTSLEYTLVRTALHDAIQKHQLHPSRTWHLHLECPGVAEAIGLSGAGVITANLQNDCVDRAMRLTDGLQTLYRDANPAVRVVREL